MSVSEDVLVGIISTVRQNAFFLFAYFSKLFTSGLLLLHWVKPQEARISMGISLVADLS